MKKYDHYTREELLQRIKELEQMDAPDSGDPGSFYRTRYAQQIFTSLPDMLTLLDRKGTIVALISANSTNHTGVPTHEMLGKPVCEVLGEEAGTRLLGVLDKAFQSGKITAGSFSIMHDHAICFYENRLRALNDDLAIWMCRDITDIRRARYRTNMLSYALDCADEEIYACDLDGTLFYANAPYCQHHQIDVHNLQDYNASDYWINSQGPSEMRRRLEKLRDAYGVSKDIVRTTNHSGQVEAWEVSSYLVYDDFNQKELIWFFSRNVTRRVIYEDRVKELSKMLEAIVDQLPIGLVVKEPRNEFRYLYWNKIFRQIHDISGRIGAHPTDQDVFGAENAERIRLDDEHLLSTNEPINFLEEYIDKKGKHHLISSSKRVIYVNEHLPLILGLLRDVTDEKEAEAELIEARIKAEESDRLKSSFLANLSHEIRTPLNAIVGFSKLISTSEDPEERQSFMEIVDTNAELLLRLINDILDFSKIEAGTLEFTFAKMDLNDLCTTSQNVISTRTQPGVKVIFERKYDKAEIICDQTRLSQVLTNLLTNAAKFTSQGEIRIGFDIVGDTVHLFVRDTGTGIEPDKLGKIFTRFVKLNKAAVGTGLGLPISKMIVERLGGQISVESEVGKGSCFHVTIPTTQQIESDDQAATQAALLKQAAQHTSRMLLVAEESNLNFRLIEKVFCKKFRIIRTQSNLDIISSYNRYRPDAVLIDLRLSPIESLQIMRRLRRLAPTLPILAISTYAPPSLAEELRVIKCVSYVNRPITQTLLKQAEEECTALLEGGGIATES